MCWPFTIFATCYCYPLIPLTAYILNIRPHMLYELLLGAMMPDKSALCNMSQHLLSHMYSVFVIKCTRMLYSGAHC